LVSNRTLAILIMTTIVVSLAGSIISLNWLEKTYQAPMPKSLTGYGVATGNVNLTIASNTSCVIDSSVDFGTASRPAGPQTISTDSNNTGTGFYQCTSTYPSNCTGMQINNTGNTFLNITINASVNSSQLMGWNYPDTDFVFYLTNGTYKNTSQGCTNFANSNTSGTVMQYKTQQQICKNLSYIDSWDTLTLEFNITMDSNIPPSAQVKTATITVYCQDTT
jgi:hypothetical protein